MKTSPFATSRRYDDVATIFGSIGLGCQLEPTNANIDPISRPFAKVAKVTEPANDQAPEADETIKQLRESFFYGSRSNLNFKFAKDLSDAEFAQFIGDLLNGLGTTIDDGDADRLVEVAHRWQVKAYRGHLADPAGFPHRHADTPITALAKPLSESTVALVTSSGHFVEGDDPEPFGVPNMTQQQAEERIVDFLASTPQLSAIPVDTRAENLRVRHGGYPVAAVATDHQVALPLGHLRSLESRGVIGELSPIAYSFVGATSQVRLTKHIAPKWAEQLVADGVDAVLAVPV